MTFCGVFGVIFSHGTEPFLSLPLAVLQYSYLPLFFVFPPCSVFASLQQAWPSGTQQILLPPAWQQLTHTSVQHATVIPDSMSSTQPLANWR